jgi:hypothetical protein
MLNINLRMVILPFEGEQIFRSMKGWSRVKTKHSFSEQKMPSFIHFREISRLRRVITRFDPCSPQNTLIKEGFE